ncbi:ChbG/HpnK family deacetylase [Psittacicella hinzii]|uniref:ChbG/HpnK family deacetylase n=1 Tax=Psittacicella hinzii TaxID=2028575 RepID=UPI001CA61661|nr:ChbG/HpnK family deacetylase [Psittacicella hinzii]
MDSHFIEICSSDFGLSPKINQATLELAKDNKINCASVLVDAPNLDYATIEEAVVLKHQGKLSLGLQLNFTELFSSHQDKDLIRPAGKLFNPLYLHCFYAKGQNKKIVHKIYQEIERQFFLFEDLFDCWPDFIVGHEHVHMLPFFAKALRKFYAEHRLDQNKIWVASLNRVNKLNKTNLPGASKFKNLILRLATKKARSRSYSMRKELLGIYNKDVTSEQFQNLLSFWYNKAQQYNQSTGRGAVILVHPSLEQEEGIPHSKARVIEYQVLKEKSPLATSN